jgi:AGCS family alanine or glycine:cation symporter
MWLTGIFGIATKYSESLIAVKYRVKDEKGAMLGGAMYALERGLHCKWLGVLFAAFAALAAFGIGCATQSASVTNLIHDQAATMGFNMPTWVPGIVITILVGLVLLGGIKWITKVCTVIVPFMAAFYVLGCIILLILNHAFLGAAIVTICKSAFTSSAAVGGFTGFVVKQAVQYGIARGLFSNESGMGSAPIVAASATTRNPVRQAMVSMTGTFYDTVIICLLTGLVIVSSVLGAEAHPLSSSLMTDVIATHDGSKLVYAAFHNIPMGEYIVVIGLFFFALSTILGWSYYGEQGCEYLFGVKSNYPYRVIYTIVCFLGTLGSALGTGATLMFNSIWATADILNALMVIPNILAVLLLSPIIAQETRKYLREGHLDDICTDPIPLRTELEKKK